jgi:hypothetical protein
MDNDLAADPTLQARTRLEIIGQLAAPFSARWNRGESEWAWSQGERCRVWILVIECASVIGRGDAGVRVIVSDHLEKLSVAIILMPPIA